MLSVAMVYTVAIHEPHWTQKAVEDKVTDFLGENLSVKIGDVSGGVFNDMTLEDVSIIAARGQEGRVFTLERMEISYSFWHALLDKLGLVPEDERSLKYACMYFSGTNPFVRGFIKLYRYPDRIEIMGHISPVLFGEERKRGVKGVFLKRDDGKYDCDLLWDGRLQMTGVFDPVTPALNISFNPVKDNRGTVKIKGSIGDNKDLHVYSRLDKVNIFGAEMIGDVWLSYRDVKRPTFHVKAENLVIDKKPYWDFSVDGKFHPQEKEIVLDGVKFGESLVVSGIVGIDAPHPVDLKLSIEELDLADLAVLLGETKTRVEGVTNGEVELYGSAAKGIVKGRVHVGPGALDNMEFRSIFATLTGQLPVVKIVDSRVVKDAGNIIITGEMDFSKIGENSVFGGILFDTDNKVAVWEEWQIEKEESDGTVEATKDRITLSTLFEDDLAKKQMGTIDHHQKEKEVGVKYKLDHSNSIKLEFEEENDFLGVEHKWQF